MQFSTDGKALRDALAGIAQMIDNRSPIPLCRTVRIEASADGLALTGANMVTLTRADAVVPAQVDAPGALCIDAQDLARWAKSLPDGAAAVFLTDPGKPHTIAAEVARRRHTFQTLPADDYPEITRVETHPGAKRIEVNARRMGSAILAASPLARRNEIRPGIAGVYLDPDGFAVATDGSALAALPIDPGIDCTIPRDAVRAMTSALDCAFASVVVSQSRIGVFAGGGSLECSTIHDPFPDWRRVVPNNPPHAAVSRDELAEALQAATLGDGGYTKISASDGCITLMHTRARSEKGAAADLSLGSGTADADADVSSDFAMNLDAGYLRAALAMMPVGLINLDRSGPNDAGTLTLRPAQEDVEQQPVAAIMGMR